MTGTAGTTATGTAGTTGSGGGSAPYACSPSATLDCTGAGLITFGAGDGMVTSFTSQEWSNTSGKFCDATGLRGSIYGYNDGHAPTDGGAGSYNAQTVDTTGNRTLNMSWHAEPGGFAGGGLSFDSCVNASAFNALRFSVTVLTGRMIGCAFQVALATQDERPTTQTGPPGGTCDLTMSSCYAYPTVVGLADPTASGMTYTVPFSSFTTAATLVVPARQQIVGIQWQVNPATTDGGPQSACVVSVAIDNVQFVNM